MKFIIALSVACLIAGCKPKTDLKPGYYQMGSTEEKRVEQILSKSIFTISIGYDGVSYCDDSNNDYIDMNGIRDRLEKIQKREMVIIHEQINYSAEVNDNTEREIISLLQATGFKTIVITSGTGNRGGIEIIKVIGE